MTTETIWSLVSNQPAVVIPETWVTLHSGDMGNNFGPKGFSIGFNPEPLVIKVPQVVVHEADEPHAVADLRDSDGLPDERLTQIHFPAAKMRTAKLPIDWTRLSWVSDPLKRRACRYYYCGGRS